MQGGEGNRDESELISFPASNLNFVQAQVLEALQFFSEPRKSEQKFAGHVNLEFVFFSGGS